MFRGMITIVFAGMVITGLTSTVCAEPIARSQARNTPTTLSGESLRGLESRNLFKDSPSLSGTAPVPDAAPLSLQDDNSLQEDNSESGNQARTISVFGITVELSPEGLSQLGLSNLEVSAGGSSVDAEQVLNVRYQLLSPARN